jgi:aminopeptidase N
MLVWQLEHDEDVLGRMEAIDELAPRIEKEVEALAALQRAADDDSLWMARARAVTSVAGIISRDSTRAMVLKATNDSDARVREAAALALSRANGNADAVARLRSLAQGDRSWWVRTAAMRALATADSAVALEVAREMLRREEWRDMPRVAALEALGRIKSPESRALIIEQLDEGERQGRVAAVAALTAHASPGDTAVALELERLLNDDDPSVRAAAATSLGRVGVAASVRALQARRAVEEEHRVRTALDQAVRRLGS